MFLSFAAAAVTVSTPQSFRGHLNGGTFPVYTDSARDPAAVLYIADLRADFQRKAFFRIGLLPMAVMTGLRVRIRSAEEVS